MICQLILSGGKWAGWDAKMTKAESTMTKAAPTQPSKVASKGASKEQKAQQKTEAKQKAEAEQKDRFATAKESLKDVQEWWNRQSSLSETEQKI